MLNVCVIGCGRAGMIHARNFCGSVLGARLYAVCDPSEEARLQAEKELSPKKLFANWEDALADAAIDAVVVATPTSTHKEIVCAAAAVKKHVLCEKPMAENEANCDAMIEACREAGVALMMGFMRRFDESLQDAHRLVEAGEIGELVLIKSLTRGPSKPQPWMLDVHTSYGPIGEVNSHDFDTLRWFSGSEVKSIYAQGGNFRSPELKGDFPDWYDTVTMSLSFADGKLGMIDGAQYVRYGYDARVELLGTEGSILIGSQPKENYAVATANGLITRPMNHSWTYLFREAYAREDQAFADCITAGSKPPVNGYDGKMAVRLTSMGLTSLLENRVVIDTDA